MLNCTNYTRKSLSTFTSSKFIVQHTAVILFCKHMCGNYIIDIGFVHSNVELNIMFNCTQLYETIPANLYQKQVHCPAHYCDVKLPIPSDV